MNQETFLKQLEELLMDISEVERTEALEYYRCYFEDAGAENETAVLEELGSPEKVAATIKADLGGDSADGGFTENGYEEFFKKDVPDTVEGAGRDTEENRKDTGRSTAGYAGERAGSYSGAQRAQNSTDVGRILLAPLWILAMICMCIVVAVVAIVLVSVAVGLIGAALTAGGTAVMLIGLAVGMFVSAAPGAACAVIGAAAICLAIFFLLLLACVAFCGKALPPAMRGICNAAAAVFRGGRK